MGSESSMAWAPLSFLISHPAHVQIVEHLQQLCNWNLPFVGICQVPKRFAKRKISQSPSVWHF